MNAGLTYKYIINDLVNHVFSSVNKIIYSDIDLIGLTAGYKFLINNNNNISS